MPKNINVAVAQAPQSGDLGENLRIIGRFVALARKAKAHLLLFPECALTGYGPRHHESSATFDPDAIAAGVEEVRELARANRMAILIGTALPLEGGWSNSLLMLKGAGRPARYDKLHLYGRDAEFYRAGRALPEPARAGKARVGMQVCFDARFPDPFRRLALAGAELIAVAAYIHGKRDMWKGPVLAGHLRSRASENGRFVAFANVAGPEQNLPSMILNPRGEVIAACRLGAAELLHATINLSAVSDEMLRCRRTDLYGCD